MNVDLDVLIFGGGGAGLWLLDELHRRGYGVLLLESRALGADQTAASQGIIHGGIKYTLSGLLSESARAIREMPAWWRECLAGRSQPDLSSTRLLADYCHLWRTTTLKSKLGMIGARAGLRSSTAPVAPEERPAALTSCPGDVFRVDEQVIAPASYVRSIAERHSARILKIDFPAGVEFVTTVPGRVEAIRLTRPGNADGIQLQPVHVVLTAGVGNAALRERVGLSPAVMQRRPLHMVMVRGDLPRLYGHCVDGAKTRATITSYEDAHGRVVWQVGGQVAEDGVGMLESELIRQARNELRSILPQMNLSGLQWCTYAVDRAEGKTPGGARPSGPQVRFEGNVFTAWPTKLALVPELAKLILERLSPAPGTGSQAVSRPANWPTAEVALPPWEQDRSWHSLD